MDAATEKHLAAWVAHQFEDRAVDTWGIFDAMQMAVVDHPELENGDRGWWRVYDIAKEKGYIKEDN